MAQSLKYLLHKHEELSLILKVHIKVQCCDVYLNQSAGKADIWGLSGSLTTELNVQSKSFYVSKSWLIESFSFFEDEKNSDRTFYLLFAFYFHPNAGLLFPVS